MIKTCLYDENHCCDIAVDYEVCQEAIKEAAELSHANWKEIEFLLNRVKQLEKILVEHGIDIPPIY